MTNPAPIPPANDSDPLTSLLLAQADFLDRSLQQLGILIVQCDSNQRMVEINDALGSGTADQWRSRPLTELLGSQCADCYQRLIAKGTESTISADLPTTDTATPQSFHGRCRALQDQEGQPAGGLLIGRIDHAEHPESRRLATRMQQRLATLARTLPHFLAWTNPCGRFAFINPAGRAMIGLAEEAALPDLEYILPQGAALVDEHGRFQGETTLRSLEGVDLPVALTIQPDDDGGATLCARDIGENLRRQAERSHALLDHAQTQRMASLGVLVASVAHEINNPNNFIVFNTPIVRNLWAATVKALDSGQPLTARTPIGQRDWTWARGAMPRLLDGIERGAKRIKEMVEQLRNYSRPQQEEQHTCDLNEAASRAIDLVDHLITKHTRHLCLSIASDLPRVALPGNVLEQILVNLVVNACQALTDPGQAVVILATANRAAEEVCLRVQDEGCGIPADILARLGHDILTTKAGGTGLGLAIVRRQLDQYHGRMHITSEPEVGTTITLQLPVAAS